MKYFPMKLVRTPHLKIKQKNHVTEISRTGLHAPLTIDKRRKVEY